MRACWLGPGLRISELSGLAVRGPDGLSDVMLDSLERGRAELRVRWDAGAKGRKARRACPRLSAHIRHGCHADGLESRARPRRDGSRGLQRPAALRLSQRRTRPWAEDRIGRIHCHALNLRYVNTKTEAGSRPSARITA